MQDAINADDEGALLKALSDVEGSPATADLSTPERQIMHLRQAAAGPGCRSEAKVRLTVALSLDFGLDFGAPRIPAMRARAEMRKELSSAIRKSEPWFAGTGQVDSGNRSLQGLQPRAASKRMRSFSSEELEEETVTLKHVIATAKRSCLPQAVRC